MTIKRLVGLDAGEFDGVVRLRKTDDGTQEFQVRGFGRRPTTWTELE